MSDKLQFVALAQAVRTVRDKLKFVGHSRRREHRNDKHTEFAR
jgi:hypothetical protein